MEKQISIVVAASGEIKDIGISEGATVGEVMKEANLVGYQLTRKGGELLTPETNIFSMAMDSEKFYATPEDVSVGGGDSVPRTTLGMLNSRISDFLDKTRNVATDQDNKTWGDRSYGLKKKVFNL